MKYHSKLLLLILGGLAGLIIVTYFITIVPLPVPTIKFNKSITPTTAPVELSTNSNWISYVHPDYNYSILLPPNATFKSQPWGDATLTSAGLNLSLTIKDSERGFEGLDEYYFLDFPIASKLVINSQPANKYLAPQGYCDGPGCGPPFVAVVFYHHSKYYNLVFFGDLTLSETEQKVLQSFKLPPTNSN